MTTRGAVRRDRSSSSVMDARTISFRGPRAGDRSCSSTAVPAYIWDSTSAALAAAGFRVIRYDQFGRGWSDRPRVNYDADLFDRQLVELLDSLGARDSVNLVGLSMGGWVVATFAERHPERTRTVTLVDPAAGPATRSYPAMMKLPVVGPLAWQVMAVPGMAEGQFSDFADPKQFPDWADKYRVQMRYRGFGRALWSTSIAIDTVDFDALYHRVGKKWIPMLLIWGMEDKTVPFASSDGVRKAAPSAEFHPIPGAGHLPHMERASVVNPILIEFLSRTR
jgi:pimeloyl-ACP methyl ester carboxylesterase